MNLKTVVPLIIILLQFITKTTAQTIDRGPFLQLVTTTSIFIHWRTDTATDSKVWYGDDPNNLTEILSSPGPFTEHEMTITGLLPNTIYYYAVGDNNGQMAGGDSDHYFKTTPSSNESIRAWVLGDAGKRDANQAAVRDAYYGFVGSNHIDMMLLLGDNAYSDGTQAEYQEAWFEDAYGYPDRLINSVMWSTFGNHDGVSADSPTQTGPYYEIFNFPANGQAGGVASGTEAYYSFDYGNMHIISLNSHDIDDSPNSPMIQWLQSDVNANTKDWLIAMFHHPAYSGGTTSMQTNALPILETAGVDLVLVGHNHRYERSFLLNGHYGNPSSFDPQTMTIDGGDGRINGDGAYTKAIGGPGTIYMTTGSAGSAGSGTNPHPIMYHNAGILGSVDIQVNDLQMDLKFIDSNGNTEDYFTIIKGDPPTVNITNPANNDFFPSPETIVISADAVDNGSVTQVEFFIDDVLIETVSNPPYIASWTMPGTGSFEIKATATDNDDYNTSSIVNIQVGEGSVCVSVDGSNEDAEEDDAGGISITSSDLELVEESSIQSVGMRFKNLNIPQGAVINSADIQFTCDKNVNINPCVLDIYAEAIDNGSSFTNNDFDVSDRSKTITKVTWSPSDWLNNGDAGPAQKTVDISPVIQEVVDRPGFDINSSIVIIIEGSGKREAESYDGLASGAPELCIEFSISGPLPVELLGFSATTVEKEIRLEWSTASEENNDYFTLERSVNGLVFTEIAIIPGNGNTSEHLKYNFIDQNPETGLNYYRLKQTDYNGEFSYSDIVNAEISNLEQIRVYPSKVKDMVTIEKSRTIKDELIVVVHDMIGNKFKSFKMTAAEFKKEISIVDLVAGPYFISVYNNYSVLNFKIIKL